MRKKIVTISLLIAAFIAPLLVWAGFRMAFPRPYRDEVERSGVEVSLVYAIIRAESGYREDAESRAGAVGLMQIKPSTAEFICEREGILFQAERLTEGEYNIFLGTKYLLYLKERFESEDTLLAAYNAGEGTVRQWLKNEEVSSDGKSLMQIPYPETAAYIKKVGKFKKIYEILYA